MIVIVILVFGVRDVVKLSNSDACVVVRGAWCGGGQQKWVRGLLVIGISIWG